MPSIHLVLEFFGDGFSENKLQFIGISILLILLSPRSGCYNCDHQGLQPPLVEASMDGGSTQGAELAFT